MQTDFLSHYTAAEIEAAKTLPINFAVGERVWILLDGKKKWLGTVTGADRVVASPPYVSYSVRCDADEQFTQGCHLGCKEHELERMNGAN